MTRKRKNLTDEEQSLWNRIAQKIKPLKPEQKKMVHSPSKSHPPILRKKDPLPLPPEAPPPSKEPPSTSTHRIQRVRKVEIRARLDLHGLTREQARVRLGRFLLSCQERRCLWVLVITGKGQRKLTTEGVYEGHSRKTLRELVPQWLEEPALRPVVSAYTTAKPQDGGSGALYVRLKHVR